MNFFHCLLVAALIGLAHGQGQLDETDSEYWNTLASEALHASLQNKYMKPAKNVVIFLGDGMGVSTVTAARTLRRQVEKVDKLGFENFPNVALIKTYNVDYTVPDSAGTATAYLAGVKTNKGVIGVNGKVKYKDQDCDKILKNKVDSVFVEALRSGKSAGIVTTTRLTDATPAGSYAHVSNRNYESSIPIADPNCKDIARQLIEDSPGIDFSVILGGGTDRFRPAPHGNRNDGLDLFELWNEKKRNLSLSEDEYKLVETRQELAQVDLNKVKYLFGSFSKKHMLYDQQRTNTSSEPSIVEMTDAAIQVLKRNDKGFFLLVEGGKIDKAHHENWANLALYDTLAFEAAIDRALNMVNLDETLVIVTADHSHGFTLNGYAKRDENIFGFSEDKDENGTTYTSLLYTTGPGYRAQRDNETLEQTANQNYRQHATIWLDSAAHGGEDVAAYATGAMSHLMRSTQQQTYVAHLMTYAACIGPYKNEAHCKNNGAMLHATNCKILILVCAALALMLHLVKTRL